MGRESAIVLTARNRAFLTRRSHSLARQAARLFHPRDELRFVACVILVDVPIAHGCKETRQPPASLRHGARERDCAHRAKSSISYAPLTFARPASGSLVSPTRRAALRRVRHPRGCPNSARSDVSTPRAERDRAMFRERMSL